MRVRCLGLSVLVVIAASDMGPQCCWALIAIGAICGWCVVVVASSSHRVVSSCHCCGMVVICCGCGCGQSLLSSVVAADMAFLCCLDGILACPGGCRWWAVVW